MAGDDLPDIMHIFFGYTLAPNLPDFFKAKCADLTPYLAGRRRQGLSVPGRDPDRRLEELDRGRQRRAVSDPDPPPDVLDPAVRRQLLQERRHVGRRARPELRAQERRRLQARPAAADQATAEPVGHRQLAGIGAQLFGLGCFAPVVQRTQQLEDGRLGKLLKDRETEEYKAAVGYMRDLFTAGVYWPDSIQSAANVRADFAGKSFAISPEGQGNSWVDFWQRGNKVTPPTRFGMLDLFPASAGRSRSTSWAPASCR